MNAWIPTLFALAALCLLPAWLVGCAALGAALGLSAANGIARRREQSTAPLPENVIRLPERRVS